MLKRIPLHPLLFSIFPVLSLLATNLGEIDVGTAVRPLAVCLGLAAASTLIVSLLMRRNVRRAALVVTGGLILFFTYGQVYSALKSTIVLGAAAGRHRVLAPALAVTAVAGFLALRRVRSLNTATLVLNLVGLMLVAFPTLTIASHQVRAAQAATRAGGLAQGLLHPRAGEPLPDIYFLVLDTYMRADALQEEFGYDNEPFLRDLEALGFYIARCGRSNYDYTQGSLASALNMDYMPRIHDILGERRLDDVDVWYMIRHSLVREELEAIGYRTVAFDSGYDWSRTVDADVYLSPRRTSSLLGSISPFEALLLRSTAASIALDASYLANANRVGGVVYPYGRHIALESFILDRLPTLVDEPGPKFVFAHILIPHIPYVFAADGSILTDPGFTGGSKSEPVNEAYRRSGYTDSVTYLNRRILEFARAAVGQSETRPIIVIIGDHGLRGENRLQALGAYLVPDEVIPTLRPDITPVNIFRATFDGFFGSSLGQLTDTSFHGDVPVEESSSACLAEGSDSPKRAPDS